MKFPLMCIEETRKNWLEGKLMFMRIVAHNGYTHDANGNFNGLTIGNTVTFCKEAKARGVDAIREAAELAREI